MVVEEVVVKGIVDVKGLNKSVVEKAIRKALGTANGKAWVGGRAVRFDMQVDSFDASLRFYVRQQDVDEFVDLLKEELRRIQEVIRALRWFKELKEMFEVDVDAVETTEILQRNGIDVIA